VDELPVLRRAAVVLLDRPVEALPERGEVWMAAELLRRARRWTRLD